MPTIECSRMRIGGEKYNKMRGKYTTDDNTTYPRCSWLVRQLHHTTEKRLSLHQNCQRLHEPCLQCPGRSSFLYILLFRGKYVHEKRYVQLQKHITVVNDAHTRRTCILNQRIVISSIQHLLQ